MNFELNTSSKRWNVSDVHCGLHVSRMLHQCGFNSQCHEMYDERGYSFTRSEYNSSDPKFNNAIERPTLSVAVEWTYLHFGIHISSRLMFKPLTINYINPFRWYYTIDLIYEGEVFSSRSPKTYESSSGAIETALYHVLSKLVELHC